MKTLKKVSIEPVYVEFIPDILEEGKFYISEKYKCAAHNCLCGCGMKTITPMMGQPPHDWKIVNESEGVISLIGSVGNFKFPCKSHYIITKNVANFV